MSEPGPTDRLLEVVLDDPHPVRRSPEVEHERAVAVYDLVEDSVFRLVGDFTGPYILRLRQEQTRLILDVRDPQETPLRQIALSIGSLRKIIKDYFVVCESYYDAIKRLPPSKIEAIDMGRRGLHNEGAEKLRTRLKDKVEVDVDTARRLFTLVCVLQIRG